MADVNAGKRLGQYRLLVPIGAGGMGRVWAALDESSEEQRFVAIKLALDEGADTKYWTALADEADVAARIQHVNVCRSFGLGTTGDIHYLVMELSDGASLRDWLDAVPGQKLPPTLAAQIGMKVAAGLHAAHELTDDAGEAMHVVHRDVSPQNVLIDRRGRVRLADFGVAKARGQLRRATETGEIKGKLSYMSPEQITSKEVDARADVFALACVIYEASLGVRAFQGGDALTTMYAILEQPVKAPSEIDPSYPKRLEAVLLRALEKQPDARFQSAAELQSALATCLDEDLTAPGDRHIGRALASVMDKQLEARHQSLCAAAERVRRGESLEPPSAALPHTVRSTTQEGVALTNDVAAPRPKSNNRAWLGLALIGVAFVAVGWLMRPGPRTAGAARPEAEHAPPLTTLTPVAEVAVTAEPPLASAKTAAPDQEELPPTNAPPLGGRPRKARTVAASVASEPTVAAAPTTTGMPAVKRGPAKPPRTIDQSNPFSN
ncbi:MAG: serine/threonine protein kinase [Polyangiaceae bacterium]|nr:serine/threonine protein kinase [Polyangiaceae bacterium]